MNKNKPHENNYLLWIGIGVFGCLVLLTCISLLDLQRDFQQTSQTGNLVAKTVSLQNVASCPYCGTRSTLKCFYCGTMMQPGTSRGTYLCPGCQRSGHAFCPYCRNTMMPPDVGVHPGRIICPRCNTPVARGW